MSLADILVGSVALDRVEDEVRRYLASSLSDRHDPRDVVTDPHARYFGVELDERTLVPAADAQLAETAFDQWLSQSTTGN